MPEILEDSRCPLKFKIGEKLRWMKHNDPEGLKKALLNLTSEEANDILYDGEIMLREKQWIDLSGPEDITVLMCGRGLV